MQVAEASPENPLPQETRRRNVRKAKKENYRMVILTTMCATLFVVTCAGAETIPQPIDSSVQEQQILQMEGIWQGQLLLPTGEALEIVFHLSLQTGGEWSATLDSPDQGAFGIPVERTTIEGADINLELPALGARFEGRLEAGENLAGRWFQGGGELPLTLTRVEEIVRPLRPQEPEGPVPYRVEEVSFRNVDAGLEMAGTLTLPEGEGPFPAVFLISGSGPQNRDSEVFGHRPFLVLADQLTRRGVAVLRADDRGVGDSEGVFDRATTLDFAGDAEAAVTFLRDWPEVDPQNVGLIGMSEGGLIAPLVAVEGEGVAFIILLAGPSLPGEELLYMQGEAIARAMGVTEEEIEWSRGVQERIFSTVLAEEEESVRAERLSETLNGLLAESSPEERLRLGVVAGREEEWMQGQITAVGGPWFRTFLLHDPRPVLERVTVPVLAHFGQLDVQVPSGPNLEAMAVALGRGRSPDVSIMEWPLLNHLFQSATTGAPGEYAQIEETMSPEVIGVIGDWILAR